ncbi:hypothetical protein CEXT_418551 [Caerostris extrusa]|uniref:NADH dehydrogenase subunit 4 n=1 Tax=Caerostris extrusa TaxID=172846 RepID=A0AAV4VLP6_CAEEX|nr:hypothetical protein CEXT_418551 [Caerostris extrusa]
MILACTYYPWTNNAVHIIMRSSANETSFTKQIQIYSGCIVLDTLFLYYCNLETPALVSGMWYLGISLPLLTSVSLMKGTSGLEIHCGYILV